ncbi:pyruvate formate-lyase-activating protein [Dactylosporangium matsuzakiense]|uniref:Pyruvate formate-lyase-activating enzyme n=1 Tax=Dactylosporangium matsuzakiense TaxID=53360 RepID=A0A9W6KU11_9ACTN|nr:pyruvate formate-lyase-activating protein [Dactylosporangium matsuzakiense]UWZ48320.1 pyruvate formate lyase-activating protein [Dactylosporangium matsuzakiense]GLL07643.1 pyruvate formate-lyase-activating enzyme [Dactylosporangium matsuzakiense]
MTTGRLHSWDLSTGVDGPGTRFVAFLSGCPLRCLYCQNPDTWHMRDGTATTAADLLDRLSGYAAFLRTAGGGLTVSGGEPLLQPAFTRALLAGARDLNLHTALDTSGALGARAGDDLLDLTSLVLLDIKCWDPAGYHSLTGGDLSPTLDFARRLSIRATPVWLRYVLVPGYTDDLTDVKGLARFAAGLGNVERVDVLPFHKLGVPKYERLGIRFPLHDTPPPTPDLTERVRAVFREAGLKTV